MEASDLFWHDLIGVQSIRQQYAQQNVRPGPNMVGNSRPQFNTQRKICQAFQTGTWHSETDHRQGNIQFTHICAYCFATFNRPFPHREQECRKKKGHRATGHGSGVRDSVAPSWPHFETVCSMSDSVQPQNCVISSAIDFIDSVTPGVTTGDSVTTGISQQCVNDFIGSVTPGATTGVSVTTGMSQQCLNL